jgi:histidyl-tRNA synthetase
MVGRMHEMVRRLTETVEARNFTPRDYPVFEVRDRLLKKYGDDEKLIYDLDYSGPGQELSLRYDLTTQHMFYTDPHQRSRTFQVGKVYRRENLSQNQSRYREFYQFDCDVVGYTKPFRYLDTLDTLNECLRVLGITSQCVIKMNNREEVNGVLEACGVPETSYNTVCSTLDKLDKYDGDWDQISRELREKGLGDEIVRGLIQAFQNTQPTTRIEGLMRNIKWDMCMVRGLDYYTGLIFEVVDLKTNKTIGGGGEYKGAIGFSLGLDRILDVYPEVGIETKAIPFYLIVPNNSDLLTHAQNLISTIQGVCKNWRVQVYPIGSFRQIKNAIVKLNKKGEAVAMVFGPKELENGLDFTKIIKIGEQNTPPKPHAVEES